MKRVIVFLALAVLTLRAGAQNTRVGNGTLNFSVPDAPAFAILGASPPSIIRPTATREVTAGIADLFRGGGVLPQNLFVEFSPWSVIGAKLTFDEYRESSFERFLYRLRLSLASRSTDQQTKCAAHRPQIGAILKMFAGASSPTTPYVSHGG